MFDDDSLSVQLDTVAPTSPASQKFGLYLKAREVRQLAEVLQGLSSRSKQERLHWLRENESVVAELVNTFTDESIATLDGAAMDRESMQLSVELMSDLRRALLMLDGLFYDQRLKG